MGASVTTADPSRLTLAQWQGLASTITYLALFAALALTAAFGFVLAHAILPSYASTALPVGPPSAPAPSPIPTVRRALYIVAAVALTLALWSFAQAVRLGIPLLTQYYPRFAM